MLLREAQEQVRVLYTARGDSASGSEDAFKTHLLEANGAIDGYQDPRQQNREGHGVNAERVVGVLLLVALEIANEHEYRCPGRACGRPAHREPLNRGPSTRHIFPETA